ncbi:MAG: Rpn family recombination-promoting nuclease/putative transposase, partial [Romboutsia sp.]|nr:Rpn family recombination-promoting nuclease/putative transposase [Romboutsia sp.]
YCVELIRDLTNEEKNIKEYPFIIPIVLYTGKQRWNVPKNINELHKSQFGFEPIEYPKYNLIDVNDYTDEELIEENTGISKAMLFEKKETDKEIMETFEKIFIKKLNKREKECLKMILENFTELRKKIGIRRVNELLEKIEEKGEIDMEALERFFIHMFQKEDELIEKEGKLSEKEGKLSEKEGKLSEKEGKLSEKEGKLSKKEGELAKREKDIKRKIQEERKAGIIETAKKMIVKNMKIEDIEEITGLSEKEILEIM